MNQKQPLNISLKSDIIVKRVFWILLGLELLIVFLDLFVNHYEWTSIGSIRRMVNITREDSLANWFSSLQVIIVGVIIWLNAIAIKMQPSIVNSKRRLYCWASIGSFFIYMGIDDAIKFHERMGTAFRTVLERVYASSGPGILTSMYSAFPSYTWQMVFGPFFLAMGIFIIWFLWKELASRKLWYMFITAICLYAIAVGFDFVEGLDNDPYSEIARFFSTKTFRIRHISKTIEEFLEMFGTTFFLVAFLENLFTLSQKWEIRIVKKLSATKNQPVDD